MTISAAYLLSKLRLLYRFLSFFWFRRARPCCERPTSRDVPGAGSESSHGGFHRHRARPGAGGPPGRGAFHQGALAGDRERLSALERGREVPPPCEPLERRGDRAD